ncbi:hypothetical protein HYFRA_00011000 [Hymenoscyphus fraxineus]|uniref:Fungal STAND N-terminal Goodbye domain-containing protein n=1 Tax=Hymenoscyphus fraxineus TaxID=746836 RepID=A0A9N9KYB3_9HELO|nr:hypothetical protein HYFRA_00011000 [Hymenoscyphus fraxineus]
MLTASDPGLTYITVISSVSLFYMEFQKPGWFEGDDTKQSRRVLPPPEKFANDHDLFKKKLQRSLKLSNRGVQIASNREDLNKQIESIQNDTEPRLAAQQILGDTSNIHDNYTVDRQHGVKKTGRKIQTFADAFGQFVSAYSGIIEVIATASGPYGEVAYQTLSIFFTVVVNKTRNDEKIAELLDDMRKTFPKLEPWKDIYPTDNMKALVATAYQQVITFCRAASEYFTRFFKRLMMAIMPQSSMNINEVAAQIYKTLAEINSEGMFGLHGRTQSIQRKLTDVLAQNRSLLDEFAAYRKEVEERVLQEDKQRLEALRKALRVTLPELETNIDDTKSFLMKVFPNTSRYVAHVPATGYLQMNCNLLHETTEYQEWVSSSHSCLLFLSGTTAAEGRKFRNWTHSWLSPIAIYITQDLARKNLPVAFFCCHPSMESKIFSVNQIISSVVLQILAKEPQILRDKAVQFLSIAQTELYRNSENSKQHVRAVLKLLEDVLAAVKALGPIFIVLDRLDQYEGKFSFLMDELVRLVGKSTCHVKLVVIADTSLRRGEWHPEYLSDENIDMDRIFVRQGWNQRKLTNLELAKGERSLTWDE